MQTKRIVIVAQPGDPSVEFLLDQWRKYAPAVLTPKDLTSPGVYHCPERPEDDRVVVQGETLGAAQILAVLPRLSAVLPDQLRHIRAIDRSYVASETTALLTSWLAALTCPVINRPRANAAVGPGWFHFRWVRAALELGLTVAPSRIEVHREDPESGLSAPATGVSVIVAGDDNHGDEVDPSLREQARRLAASAAVDLLEVRFSGPEPGASVLWASVTPVLAPPVAASLLTLIEKKSATSTKEGRA